MPGMSSLYIAISGLHAAQAGLYVTGHNISNNNIVGYVRQQALQSDYVPYTAGMSTAGLMQVGLGTDIDCIRQIRENFLDMPYRRENSKLGYYSTKYNTGLEIESVLGELEGEYKMQSVIQDIWEALQEFEMNPTAMETRANFIETAKVFIEKFNDGYDSLYKYQLNLNEKVKSEVQQINTLVKNIDNLNRQITMEEASGDYANDLRDQRNNCLDTLSGMLDITYVERPNGYIDILCEGKDLLVGGHQSTLGLRYTSENWDFVEPVFTSSTSILPYDERSLNATPLFNFKRPISDVNGNDNGSLKALLICRGTNPVNYTKSVGQLDPADKDYKKDYFNATQCTIPRIMIQLDTLFHEIVTSINDALAPYDKATGEAAIPAGKGGADGLTAPYDWLMNQPMLELFTRIPPAYSERFVGSDGEMVYVGENPDIMYSLYSIGNVVINREFSDTDGYTKLAVALTPQIHDKGVLEKLVDKWNKGFVGIDNETKVSVMDFYKKIVSNVAVETSEAGGFVESQGILIEQADYKRQSIMGVSLDEEMKNMMMYQHAYNASARVLNVIDSMLDKLVNATGNA